MLEDKERKSDKKGRENVGNAVKTDVRFMFEEVEEIDKQQRRVEIFNKLKKCA